MKRNGGEKTKWNRTHASWAHMKSYNGDGNDHHKKYEQQGREREREKEVSDRIYDCAGWPQHQQQQQQIIEQTSTNEIKVNKFGIKSQLMSLINDPTNCPFCISRNFLLLLSRTEPWNNSRFLRFLLLRSPPHPQKPN